MQIEISADGYWIDGEGKRWRLVPEKADMKQMDAAEAKAKRCGLKGKHARAAAWDYMMGYYELLEHAPVPTSTTHNAKVS